MTKDLVPVDKYVSMPSLPAQQLLNRFGKFQTATQQIISKEITGNKENQDERYDGKTDSNNKTVIQLSTSDLNQI